MLYPSVDQLMKRVDSKYTLVVAAAKRAREITEGKTARQEDGARKAVSLALEEIASGRIKYERTKTGIK